MEHWSNEFEHESLATPEAKESFTSAMSKYETQEEALLGGFNAMKSMGKPFKLPESLDKLPDDNIRNDFRSQASKLLGIEDGISDIKAFDDIDFSDGLPDGVVMDEDFVNSYKQFAIDTKKTRSQVEKEVGFYKQALTKATEKVNQKIEAQKLEAANKTNEALIAHFGSKEEVAKQSELVRRAFQNHAGLTAQEYEEVGEALADSALTKNPVLTRALVKLVAPLAAEGSTDKGTGGNPPPKQVTVKDMNPKTAKALGW